jgi:hypothetical protein
MFMSFVKCLLKAEGFGKKNIALGLSLRWVKEGLNLIMQRYNLHCYVNLKEMVKELQEEYDEDVNKFPLRPKFTGGFV